MKLSALSLFMSAAAVAAALPPEHDILWNDASCSALIEDGLSFSNYGTYRGSSTCIDATMNHVNAHSWATSVDAHCSVYSETGCNSGLIETSACKNGDDNRFGAGWCCFDAPEGVTIKSIRCADP